MKRIEKQICANKTIFKTRFCMTAQKNQMQRIKLAINAEKWTLKNSKKSEVCASKRKLLEVE